MKKIILRPHITEKASVQSNVNAYTFVVDSSATKLSLLNEIKNDHKVTPVKINITNLPAKRVFIRGNKGVTAPLKKAVVFLKKGDTIKLG
jgi:ribosomal protein L23